MKKKKGNVRDAIEAVKGGLDSGSGNGWNVHNAPRIVDMKGNLLPVNPKWNVNNEPKGQPLLFGDGPQWQPKGDDGRKQEEEGSKRTKAADSWADLSYQRASIKCSNRNCVPEQAPATAMR